MTNIQQFGFFQDYTKLSALSITKNEKQVLFISLLGSLLGKEHY